MFLGVNRSPQDMAGVKTLVTPSSSKDLPSQDKREVSAPKKKKQKSPETKEDEGGSNSNENQDSDAARRPADLPADETKQRGQPLPSDHNEQRDRKIKDTDPSGMTDLKNFTFNGPDSQPDSRHRKKMLSPIRTPGKPGDQYGHPTKYDYNMPTRRHDAGLKTLFPKRRQKQQGGPAKEYYKRRYQRGKNRVKRLMERRYKVLKTRPTFKRDLQYRRQYPHRYNRRGVGVRTPAERSKEWREKQKKASQPNLYLYDATWWDLDSSPELRVAMVSWRPETEDARITFWSDREREPASVCLPVQDALFSLIPFEEEGIEELLNEVEDAFGPEIWEEFEDPASEDFLVEAAELLHRDQTSPSKLTQNIKQKNKGTPRQDKSKNDYTHGKPAPGNSKGNEPPTTWVGPMTGEPGISDTSKYPKNRAQPLRQPAVEQQSGSSRVIPDTNRSTGDLSWRNKNAPIPDRGFKVGHSKKAVTIRAVMENVDPLIVERSKEYTPQLMGFVPIRQAFRFQTGKYEQWVRVLPRKGSKKQILDGMEIRVRCSCPYHRWQGPEHWATEQDYQYGQLQGTASFPVIRDPEHEHAVCKHLVAVFRMIRNKRLKVPQKKQGHYLPDTLEGSETSAAERVASRYLTQIG